MEYEIKVLDINVPQIRKKLKEIGCKKVHKAKKFRRNVYYLCDEKTDGFVRVRDEGTNVTITTKIYKNKDFPEETEISIHEDFDTATRLLETMGFNHKAYQESIREKYSHPLAHEIVIDNIPGIPSYMEIDCHTKENLDKLIQLLEVDTKQIRTGSFDKQFLEYYGIEKQEFTNTKKLNFKEIREQIKPKKNEKLFTSVTSKYNEKYLKAADMPIKVMKHAVTAKKCKKCKKGTRKKCVKVK